MSSMFNRHFFTASSDSLGCFSSLDTINNTVGRGLNISLVAVKLLSISITSFAYFKVFRIICHHQQQVQTNVPPQNFGQLAINLAKYKKSVVTILYISSLCLNPVSCLSLYLFRLPFM